ncbi:MAG: hypothetical protein MJZ76_08525 [Bacteroidales bacterium]|nr:hypothetical protein [Bacteroidales bacterium]
MKEFSEDQRKHIEIIEATITRMSENSKQMKAWFVTLASAVVGVYLSTTTVVLLVVAIVANILFWGLDAYYLLLERRFRCVYNDVVGIANYDDNDSILPKKEIPLYGLPINGYKDKKRRFINTFFSISVFPFYIVIMVSLVIVFLADPIKKDENVLKVSLQESALGIDIHQPLKVFTTGMDSIWIKNESLNLNVDDTLYVKNFNKCAKYIPTPCK